MTALAPLNRAIETTKGDAESLEAVHRITRVWHSRLGIADSEEARWQRLNVGEVAWLARRAQDQGKQVYCRYGPGVPLYGDDKVDEYIRKRVQIREPSPRATLFAKALRALGARGGSGDIHEP